MQPENPHKQPDYTIAYSSAKDLYEADSTPVRVFRFKAHWRHVSSWQQPS